MKNYYKFKFFIFLFGCFLILSPLIISAANLEVEYPKTITGSTVTSESDLTQYLKYLFDFGISIGLAIAVFTMIISGVLYFLSPVPGALAIAKDRLSGAISGLLILLLTYMIITTINPYLAIFTLKPLDKVDITIEDPGIYGVNFYKSENCSDESKTYTGGVADFGDDLTNKIRSVKIVQNTIGKEYYIAILYNNTNYWGSCQYVNPNDKGCQLAKIDAASASIYVYDFDPSGTGSITLYRESFNDSVQKSDNKNGGYLEIKQNNIKKLYWKKLDELKFTGTIGSDECTVPKEDQNCVEWDKYNKCTKYDCPTLAKENITSIKINGDYIVLLIYIGPNDDTNSFTYSYCQAFPTKDEINKIGPQQVKWDPIQSEGREPNYILIIPIKN
jgi:hypothetical protein